MVRQLPRKLLLIVLSALWCVSLFARSDADSPVMKSNVQPLLLDAIVNHRDVGIIAIYYYNAQDNVLYASQTSIDSWGISVDVAAAKSITMNGQVYYCINDMKGFEYKVDLYTLKLNIEVPARYFNKNTVQIGHRNVIQAQDGTKRYAAFFNYNVYSLYGDHQRTINNAYSTLGLLMPKGSLTQSFLVQPKGANELHANQAEFVVLNTQYRIDSADTLHTYLIGDANTTAADWSGSVPFGGIKIYKNYGINPNIITFPQPNIVGNAALPSTVELSVNNVPISNATLNSGNFEFNNVPVLTGFNVIAVKQTNVLGESTINYVPYFTSPQLLAKGLDTYSISMGALRNNFGIDSFDYSDALVVLNYARGITNKFTSSVHSELLAKQQNIGMTQTFSLGNSEGTFSAAVSHADPGRLGVLSAASYEYQGIQGLSAGGNITVASPHFADTSLLTTAIFPPKYTFQVFTRYSLNNHHRLQLSYFQSKLRSSTTLENVGLDTLNQLINISYSFSTRSKFNFGLNAAINLRNRRDWQLNASIQYTFNNDFNSLGVNSAHQYRQDHYGVSLQGTTDKQRHALRYEAAVNHTSSTNENDVSGDMKWENQYGDFSVFGNYTKRQSHIAFRIASSITFMDGGVYLAEPVNTSLALVKAPELPNTTVYYNNQNAGKTDQAGKILIPNLSPFTNNKIALSVTHIPINMSIQKTELNIVPGYLNAIEAKFAIKKIKSVVIELVDAKGEPLPMGSEAVLNEINKNNAYLVGYGGVLYLEDIPHNLTHLSGEATYQNKKCHFSVQLPQGYKNSVQEGVSCKIAV